MTVKVPPPGTKGAPIPRLPAWLARRVSGKQLSGFRTNGGATTSGGLHALILETIGAKTGQTRTAQLGYLEEPVDSWLVIASLIGAARNPGWLHNLAKNPDATIEFGDGTRVPVSAETLHGSDLDDAWVRIATDAPEYVKYRSKTDRELAVVRLTRR
jgi:deazaflavin-dependent oxidoreductase (nitroreductase family)